MSLEENKMKIAKGLSILGIVAMTAVLFYGFTEGSFFDDGGELLRNPWGIVSIVDLYVGFTLFSLWIAFREKSVWISVLWIISVMILGFFAASVYVFYHLQKSGEDVLLFFLGARKNKLVKAEIEKNWSE